MNRLPVMPLIALTSSGRSASSRLNWNVAPAGAGLNSSSLGACFMPMSSGFSPAPGGAPGPPGFAGGAPGPPGFAGGAAGPGGVGGFAPGGFAGGLAGGLAAGGAAGPAVGAALGAALGGVRRIG